MRVSIELLQDAAFDIEGYIIKEFSYAFGVAEEQAFCVGTGVNQPTGIFTADGGEIGVTAGSATAVTIDDVINLVYSLKAPYRKNAKFLMNEATVSLIRKLKDGNGNYLWQPSVQAGQPDKILGYDVFTTPFAPTIAGGALAIAFGDFSNYWIGDRGGRTVQRLNELYATNGQVGYVATERVDGKVIPSRAIKLLKMKSLNWEGMNMSYNTKNYTEQGSGETTHIGGKLIIDEGGSVEASFPLRLLPSYAYCCDMANPDEWIFRIHFPRTHRKCIAK